MPTPITDGLTLLIALRDSHTPAKVTNLALDVVSANPHAPAEEVFKALQDGGAKEGTLNKALQLMQTGELQVNEVVIDPLDVLAIQRGMQIAPPSAGSVADLINDNGRSRIAELTEQLEKERRARQEAEALLESATGPGMVEGRSR